MLVENAQEAVIEFLVKLDLPFPWTMVTGFYVDASAKHVVITYYVPKYDEDGNAKKIIVGGGPLTGTITVPRYPIKETVVVE